MSGAKKKVPEMLRESASVYEQRNTVYKDTYKRHGAVVKALFPDGVKLDGVDDQNRFALLTMIIGKLTRYCSNFSEGGHDDSLLDLSTYSAMLREVDSQAADSLAGDEMGVICNANDALRHIIKKNAAEAIDQIKATPRRLG